MTPHLATFEQRLLLHTHPLRRGAAETLALRARVAGLEATHTHDRRLLIRTHLIIITGPRPDMKRFMRHMNRYYDAVIRRDTADSLRRRRARQRAAIRRDLAATTTPTTKETKDGLDDA